ncbi:MAG TPA: outer membrane lipoprotein-sorting protein [Kofleriaceae bacterium]|nr:outer membrane lipoprotein-sorting protein [Kofleriaceae bacterium]
MSRVSKIVSGAAVALAVVLPPAAARAGAPTGGEIMEALENRNDGQTQISKVTLEVTPKQGTKRLRELVLMRKEYENVTKLVTFFLAPTDVRDSAFLVFDRRGADDLRWLYLPAIGQVRQLSAQSDRQSFFGSDFVYEDLTNRDPDLDTHKLVATQKVNEWDCWVVESTPKNARGLDFATYRTWVWKDANLLVRQEFFDSAGKVVRRAEVSTVKKIQDIWTWQQVTMTNTKTGSSSKVQLSDVRYNVDVPDERFAESQLGRGAPKL